MAKIPIKPIWEFSNKHYKEIVTALGAAGKVGLGIIEKIIRKKKERYLFVKNDSCNIKKKY